MDNEEFHKMMQDENKRLQSLMTAKNNEYSVDGKPFTNFKEIGKRLNLHPIQVALVYMNKHWESIHTWVKDKLDNQTRERTESIEGRIDDLQNYLHILRGMIREGKETK